jgi:hypothetical protein
MTSKSPWIALGGMTAVFPSNATRCLAMRLERGLISAPTISALGKRDLSDVSSSPVEQPNESIRSASGLSLATQSNKSGYRSAEVVAVVWCTTERCTEAVHNIDRPSAVRRRRRLSTMCAQRAPRFRAALSRRRNVVAEFTGPFAGPCSWRQVVGQASGRSHMGGADGGSEWPPYKALSATSWNTAILGGLLTRR